MAMLTAKGSEKREAGMHCHGRLMADADGNRAVGDSGLNGVLPYLIPKPG